MFLPRQLIVKVVSAVPIWFMIFKGNCPEIPFGTKNMMSLAPVKGSMVHDLTLELLFRICPFFPYSK
jgi:hypothetical protein